MPQTLLQAVNLNESRSEHHRVFAAVIPLDGRNGYLFGVMDLRGIDGDTKNLLNLFIEQVTRGAQAIVPESNLQHQFEQMVQGVNERIAEAFGSEGREFKASEINALLGIAGDDQLYLTGVGDMTALFLHRNEEQRYKVFNLFRGIQTEHHIPEWHKLLSVVLDGTLHAGDVFLVGNKEIPQHIDAEDLHQILVTLPPAGAVEKIRQYFPFPTDIGLFLLRAEEAQDAKAMELSGAASSMNYAHQARKTTSRMLEHERPHAEDWARGVKITVRVVVALIVSGINVALAILMGLVKGVLHGVNVVARSDKKHAWGSIRSGLQSRFRKPGSIRGSHGKNKRLVKIIGVIAIVFALIMVTALARKNRERNAAAYRELVSDIEQTFDTASASIIYKDENQARELLLEGLASINQLPRNSKEREDKAMALQTSFLTLLSDLRHTIAVNELELLASLPEGEEATLLGFDNETPYAFTTTGSVYRYEKDASRLARIETQAPENFGTPIRSRYDDVNDVLYLFDGRQIARLDPDQATYEIVAVENLGQDQDIEYFAARIYTLSPGNEQVYRHDRSGSGFGSGSGWIQARTTPLRDALSFSIDGSVWILKADGRIVRYQGGIEEAWPNPTIDPALPASATLWTTDRISSLYLLDREGSRLVRMNKTDGKLLAQYTHEAFKNLRGIWEKDDAMIILTPSGLYRFEIDTGNLGN